MPLEDVADRLIRNFVTEIRHRTHDPVISSTWVFLGQSHYQTLDLLIDRRTTNGFAKPRSVEFFSNQLSIPEEQRIRLGRRCYIL